MPFQCMMLAIDRKTGSSWIDKKLTFKNLFLCPTSFRWDLIVRSSWSSHTQNTGERNLLLFPWCSRFVGLHFRSLSSFCVGKNAAVHCPLRSGTSSAQDAWKLSEAAGPEVEFGIWATQHISVHLFDKPHSIVMRFVISRVLGIQEKLQATACLLFWWWNSRVFVWRSFSGGQLQVPLIWSWDSIMDFFSVLQCSERKAKLTRRKTCFTTWTTRGRFDDGQTDFNAIYVTFIIYFST